MAKALAEARNSREISKRRKKWMEKASDLARDRAAAAKANPMLEKKIPERGFRAGTTGWFADKDSGELVRARVIRGSSWSSLLKAPAYAGLKVVEVAEPSASARWPDVFTDSVYEQEFFVKRRKR